MYKKIIKKHKFEIVITAETEEFQFEWMKTIGQMIVKLQRRYRQIERTNTLTEFTLRRVGSPYWKKLSIKHLTLKEIMEYVPKIYAYDIHEILVPKAKTLKLKDTQMRSDAVMIQICNGIEQWKTIGKIHLLAEEVGIEENRLKDILSEGYCEDDEYIDLAKNLSVL